MALKSSMIQIDEVIALLLDKWHQLSHYLHHSIHPTMPLVLYASAAALLGFIVKRYMQSLINSFLIALILIGGAHYCGILTLNLVKINHLLGLSSHYSLQSYSSMLLTWIRNNTLISAWSAGGFFIGYSLA